MESLDHEEMNQRQEQVLQRVGQLSKMVGPLLFASSSYNLLLQIEEGRTEGMSDDRKTLKAALKDNFGLTSNDDGFGPFDPPLRGLSKSEWGFRHAEIGPILAPHSENWEDRRFTAS